MSKADYISIPPAIASKFDNMDVTGDITFVNGIPFQITLGKRVTFTTVENIRSRKEKDLVKGI